MTEKNNNPEMSEYYSHTYFYFFPHTYFKIFTNM